MPHSVSFQCLDNENKIDVIIEDGAISQFWVQDGHFGISTCITIDDLEAAISEAKDLITELENKEKELS